MAISLQNSSMQYYAPPPASRNSSHSGVNALHGVHVYYYLVIARSAATKQSIELDRHALVPRARDDKSEC